jgi:membrane-bound lytic murein transglycosylase F
MNARESIFGGAKYLSSIEKRFPPEIKGVNRWFFALAAYNVGMGHVHDAQVLARKLNKNPYSWSDMRKVLPLLSQKKYYRHLKYGYARGSEPVRYIKSIQDYVDIIHKKR